VRKKGEGSVGKIGKKRPLEKGGKECPLRGLKRIPSKTDSYKELGKFEGMKKGQ